MNFKFKNGAFSWDSNWRQMPTRWRLVALRKKEPMSFESFSTLRREYGGRSAGNETLKELYEKQVDHSKRFYGAFQLGDIVEAVILRSNVLLLTREWEGHEHRKDHSDLEFWLRTNWTLRGQYFSCEVYQFGTLYVPRGGIEEAMGEKPGQYKVSHFQNEPRAIFDQRNVNTITFLGIDRAPYPRDLEFSDEPNDISLARFEVAQ